MDPWTAETLGQMVKYIKSDSKIARYLDIDEDRVRTARGYIPGTRRTVYRGRDRKGEGE
jgi:hypothetical protein